jgi:hypothetical protein
MRQRHRAGDGDLRAGQDTPFGARRGEQAIGDRRHQRQERRRVLLRHLEDHRRFEAGNSTRRAPIDIAKVRHRVSP